MDFSDSNRIPNSILPYLGLLDHYLESLFSLKPILSLGRVDILSVCSVTRHLTINPGGCWLVLILCPNGFLSCPTSTESLPWQVDDQCLGSCQAGALAYSPWLLPFGRTKNPFLNLSTFLCIPLSVFLPEYRIFPHFHCPHYHPLHSSCL